MRRLRRHVRHWRETTPAPEIVLALAVGVLATAFLIGAAFYLGLL